MGLSILVRKFENEIQSQLEYQKLIYSEEWSNKRAREMERANVTAARTTATTFTTVAAASADYRDDKGRGNGTNERTNERTNEEFKYQSRASGEIEIN